MSLEKKIHPRDSEQIIAIFRRSPLTYAWRYAISLLILLTASFLMFWLLNQGWWGELLFGICTAAGLLFILETWFFNFSTTLIVTTERVVDVERSGWFDETVSSVNYTDIKDVAFRRRGVLAAVFDYGLLTIAVKSREFILEFDHLRHPHRAQSLITEKIEAYRRERRYATIEAIYNNFLKIIPELSAVELRRALDVISKQLEGPPAGDAPPSSQAA